MTKILIKMIPEKGKPVLWEELSWKDIENLTKTMKMVIVPIGACEQHGPHLPLAVDTIDCYEIAKRVSSKTGVPVIPPLMYGCSQSHGKFPGTVSIRPETMIRMICEIAEWLYNSNIRKILLLNGHMWNWGPLYSARENMRYDYPDLQVKVLDWWATTPDIMAQSTKDCPALPSYVPDPPINIPACPYTSSPCLRSEEEPPPAPTFSITPEKSIPKVAGNCRGTISLKNPSRTFQSDLHQLLLHEPEPCLQMGHLVKEYLFG